MNADITLSKLEEHLQFLKQEHHRKVSIQNELMQEKNSLTAKGNELWELDLLKTKTAKFLTQVGDYARSQAKSQLESIVSSALTHVFNEQTNFKIEYDIKRGVPVANFLIVNQYGDEIVENEPEDERGGGLVDVVSTALRIALAESLGVTGPIIMDEPAKQLSKEYIPAFADFLVSISRDFNRQFIIITHNPVLANCGEKIYRAKKVRGVSKLSELQESETE